MLLFGMKMLPCNLRVITKFIPLTSNIGGIKNYLIILAVIDLILDVNDITKNKMYINNYEKFLMKLNEKK